MPFSWQNLPYGVATSASQPEPQCVTRYEDDIIFLSVLQDAGVFKQVEGLPANVFKQPTLNEFAALPKTTHKIVRKALQGFVHTLSNTTPPEGSIVPAAQCKLHLPVQTGDFSDFCCSKEHNLRASEVIFGEGSLPPAFYQFPIGYTGRSASISVSGTPIQRPLGVSRDPQAPKNTKFGPSSKIDFELELACVIGEPVPAGKRCPVEEAENHIFGYVIMNDWSARDIQALEMIPLGPLNGKSFGTTISPWIITPEALEPFYKEAPTIQQAPAPYLARSPRRGPSIVVQAEVINSQGTSTSVCKVRSEWMYWTFSDMVAHQAINGCALRTGDLLATGTISGTGDDEHGCLLESTMGGKTPLTLANGDKRSYLEDGDTVRFVGWAGGENASDEGVIEFGECTGQIVPAAPWE